MFRITYNHPRFGETKHIIYGYALAKACYDQAEKAGSVMHEFKEVNSNCAPTLLGSHIIN